MGFMVLSGRYWTWEKVALFFCIFNLIYIPAAFLVHPNIPDIFRVGIVPHFPGGLNGQMFFFPDGQYRYHHRALDDSFSKARWLTKGWTKKISPGARLIP
jgi:hypothetical protein